MKMIDDSTAAKIGRRTKNWEKPMIRSSAQVVRDGGMVVVAGGREALERAG